MGRLNEQQQAVVDSISSNILVLAGAGAGKTHTMLERIDKLVQSVDPSRILVLTFTNKAAFEMKSRYKEAHKGLRMPEFRTFHSFCYHILVFDKLIRTELGYQEPPKVCDTATLKRIETEAKMQCNIKLSDDKLKGKEALTLTEKRDVELYHKALKRLLKVNNLVTFDILADEVSKLFISGSALTDVYKSRYKYIFVDEFQDTDPNQVRFLNSFKETNFCFIGDCLQNIYAFRGCTNEMIKVLAKNESWDRIRLFMNYRSTNQICDFANKMSKYADKDYRIEMKGQRDGDPVRVIEGAHAGWNSAVDERHLNKLVAEILAHRESRDVAVLCRTNREVKCICDRFKNEGILYSSGSRNEDALHILKSVGDNEYMLDWLSSFLTSEEYTNYIRLASQQENPDIFWFAKEYNNIPDIKDRGKAIVEIRKILKSSKIQQSKAADILKVLGIKSGDIESITDDCDIISTLIDLIESQGDQDIYVGTIHSSKGLEYDTVYVMGVNDKSFQLRDEDMKNLYYVALTRAKNHLIVFTA